MKQGGTCCYQEDEVVKTIDMRQSAPEKFVSPLLGAAASAAVARDHITSPWILTATTFVS